MFYSLSRIAGEGWGEGGWARMIIIVRMQRPSPSALSRDAGEGTYRRYVPEATT